MGLGQVDAPSPSHSAKMQSPTKVPQQHGDPPSKRILLPRPIVDAMAGAVAGAAARMVVSPLDVIKIRFQVQLEPIQSLAAKPNPLDPGHPVAVARLHGSKYTGLLQAARDILREEGVLGFWRGTVPGLLLVMPYCSIQFAVLHKFQALVTNSTTADGRHRQMNPLLSFAGGSVAGVAATVGSYPFDLLRTVLASQGEPKVYPSMLAAARSIVQQRGLPGLFAGLGPTLVEIVPYAGLQFGLYDAAKRSMRRWNELNYRAKQRVTSIQFFPSSPSTPFLSPQAASTSSAPSPMALHTPPRSSSSSSPSGTLRPSLPPPSAVELSVAQKFFCGLVAGTLAKVVCHPLDVVKKRFQVEGLARHPKYGARIQPHAYRGMFDALVRISRAEGLQGLYKGTLPSVLKAAPSAAVTFLVYDLLAKRWVAQFCEDARSQEKTVRMH